MIRDVLRSLFLVRIFEIKHFILAVDLPDEEMSTVVLLSITLLDREGEGCSLQRQKHLSFIYFSNLWSCRARLVRKVLISKTPAQVHVMGIMTGRGVHMRGVSASENLTQNARPSLSLMLWISSGKK